MLKLARPYIANIQLDPVSFELVGLAKENHWPHLIPFSSRVTGFGQLGRQVPGSGRDCKQSLVLEEVPAFRQLAG